MWGRYLGDKEDVSKGVTTAEADLIHSEGAKVLLISNQFTNATGYENGRTEAQEAINYAKELGVPEGVALFADIEPGYPVDAEFIRGWHEAITAAAYTPGIYGIFDTGRALFSAFNDAAENNGEIKENMILWTASPNVGISTQEEAPEFQPQAPQGAFTLGWQYGIDSGNCNIDTNLFKGELLDVLW